MQTFLNDIATICAHLSLLDPASRESGMMDGSMCITLSCWLNIEEKVVGLGQINEIHSRRLTLANSVPCSM